MNVRSMLIAGVMVGSVALNVYQTWEIWELTAVGERGDPLAVGSHVSPLQVKDLDGRTAVLGPFSENCRWCEKNAGNVNVLEEQTRGRYRVFENLLEVRLPDA